MSKRVLRGVVKSNAGAKTISVEIERRVAHPIYKKQYKISRKIAVHDEENQASIGDTVEIRETKPISRSKRWELVKIISKLQKIGDV